MLKKFKKAFILAPHTDDGELGCGGSIVKLIENNVEVFYIAFSTAEESVPSNFPKDILEKEVKNAINILGIRKENLIINKFPVRKLFLYRQEILDLLINLKRKKRPDLIIMPSINDIHQDHQTIAQEGLRAFKDTTIWSYEMPWNNLSFFTTLFIKLDEFHIKKKIDALNQYKSQEHRKYLSYEFIYSLAKARGIQIGVEFAEVFEVVRWVIK